MSDSSDDAHLMRQHLKTQYKSLYGELLAIVFRHDPIGISFEDNADEYDPEVGTILPRLKDAQSVEDVRRIVHEEFVHWFDENIAGPETRYTDVARDLWAAWQRHSSEQDSP